MSFILDALKKSETDRQQQSNAEFAAVPTSAPAPAVPRWLWVVGGLLAVNLAVLIGVLLRPDADVPAALPVELAAPAALKEATTPPQPAASSFSDRVATARENAPQQQPEATPIVVQPRNTNTVQPDLISQNPASIPASDLYPSIQEMRVKGQLDIPELHLDIHVYSATPGDRFVFINMTKHREGSQLAEGPVVSEIVPEGVVLGHQDQFFLLPRE